MSLYNGGHVKCANVYPDIYSESEFVLVVITADGNQLNLYKNGVAQEPTIGQPDCHYQIDVNGNTLQIGANHFGGTIKSFAVWDRALNQDEIAGIGENLTCPTT